LLRSNSIDEDFSKFTPAFTANMAWTTDVSTYLRIATGYKAGGISEAGAVGTFNSAFVFEPEEILTYELGPEVDAGR
jgi:iron complex outermembrane receptor protein